MKKKRIYWWLRKMAREGVVALDFLGADLKLEKGSSVEDKDDRKMKKHVCTMCRELLKGKKAVGRVGKTDSWGRGVFIYESMTWIWITKLYPKQILNFLSIHFNSDMPPFYIYDYYINILTIL